MKIKYMKVYSVLILAYNIKEVIGSLSFGVTIGKTW